jgi:hypothetical protein
MQKGSDEVDAKLLDCFAQTGMCSGGSSKNVEEFTTSVTNFNTWIAEAVILTGLTMALEGIVVVLRAPDQLCYFIYFLLWS